MAGGDFSPRMAAIADYDKLKLTVKLQPAEVASVVRIMNWLRMRDQKKAFSKIIEIAELVRQTYETGGKVVMLNREGEVVDEFTFTS